MTKEEVVELIFSTVLLEKENVLLFDNAEMYYLFTELDEDTICYDTETRFGIFDAYWINGITFHVGFVSLCRSSEKGFTVIHI